jgi:hypothetical protein
MITDKILELEGLGLTRRYRFVNTIHDSLVFVPKVERVEACIEVVSKIMQAPCPKLVNEATGPQGLRVAVEVAVGRNMGKHTAANMGGMKEYA